MVLERNVYVAFKNKHDWTCTMFTNKSINWQLIISFLPENHQRALQQASIEVLTTIHLFLVIVGIVRPVHKHAKTYNSLYWNPLQIKILEGYPARRHPT